MHYFLLIVSKRLPPDSLARSAITLIHRFYATRYLSRLQMQDQPITVITQATRPTTPPSAYDTAQRDALAHTLQHLLGKKGAQRLDLGTGPRADLPDIANMIKPTTDLLFTNIDRLKNGQRPYDDARKILNTLEAYIRLANSFSPDQHCPFSPHLCAPHLYVAFDLTNGDTPESNEEYAIANLKLP